MRADKLKAQNAEFGASQWDRKEYSVRKPQLDVLLNCHTSIIALYDPMLKDMNIMRAWCYGETVPQPTQTGKWSTMG